MEHENVTTPTAPAQHEPRPPGFLRASEVNTTRSMTLYALGAPCSDSA